MYPSITACPKRFPGNVFNGTNFSIFQRSLNMSEVMHNLRFYQRNKTGHWYNELYRHWERKDDFRDINQSSACCCNIFIIIFQKKNHFRDHSHMISVTFPCFWIPFPLSLSLSHSPKLAALSSTFGVPPPPPTEDIKKNGSLQYLELILLTDNKDGRFLLQFVGKNTLSFHSLMQTNTSWSFYAVVRFHNFNSQTGR